MSRLDVVFFFFFVVIFFFKQKTAYEIYQCDWSSDVCSSDLYANPDGKQAFLPYQMALDGGSSAISRAAEGHFEMIEMGTLVNDNLVENAQSSAAAATHSGGSPVDCGQLVAAWTDPDSTILGDEGYWLQPIGGGLGPITDLLAPSGGLFGGAAIVNVGGGAMYSYDAKAINGFASDVITAGGIDRKSVV